MGTIMGKKVSIQNGSSFYDPKVTTKDIRHYPLKYGRGVGSSLDEYMRELADKVMELNEQIAEVWLLAEIPQTKDVYSMSYEEYMELPGRARL